MRRALVLWWIPLAVCSPHVAGLSPVPAFAASMPLTNGVQRAFFGAAKTASLPSRSQHGARVLHRMLASSVPERRLGSSSGTAGPSAKAKGEGVEQGRRASSRYIPSDYRGVRGGPKGKWKARIVSKGGLRQLGTFG